MERDRIIDFPYQFISNIFVGLAVIVWNQRIYVDNLELTYNIRLKKFEKI